MVKRFFSGLTALALALFLFPHSVRAAEPLPDDNHTDTLDYCLRANDVSLGLKELTSYKTQEELEEAILKVADPRVLVRNNLVPIDQWKQVPLEELEIDFSRLQPQATDEGYLITVTPDSIREGVASTVSFWVYVKDDLPEQPLIPLVATVTFAGELLPDMEFEVGSTLRLEELQIPLKEDAVFSGWYLDETLETPFLLLGDPTYNQQQVNGHLVLYPKWETIPSPDPVPETPITPPESQEPSAPHADEGTSFEPGKPAETPNPPPSLEKPEIQSSVGSVQPKEPALESDKQENVEELPLAPMAVAPNPTPTTQGKRNVGPLEVGFLTLGSVAASALSLNIASDIRVLRWYARKKAARGGVR